MEQNGKSQDVVQVTPRGEIDMQSWLQFADQLGSAVNSGAKYIDLCLEDVTFLDSSGIRVIVESANRAKENDCSIYVRGARGEVRKVLEISGILGSILNDSPIPS